MDLKMSGFAVEFAGYAWAKAVCGKKICGFKNIPGIRVEGV